MRLIVDSLVAVMLSAILAAVVFSNREEKAGQEQVQAARDAIHAITRQIKLKVALGEVELNERGHATAIDPEWFEGRLPENPYVGDGHPWLEIAGVAQIDMDHPPNRLATDYAVAKFWYNPANGTVRARVPATVSDARALALYNSINDCNLQKLFDASAPQ